ncbi:MAG: hypothetical protein E6K72_06010 [Candidatus Eisenbacteria bacterium]|uniref:Glycosyltransferase RgtA/B/C/D-like domain-containing protein n=1 Tax=Eiseniibacteriota bacterium TaxID=2212470 RepID=A0A538SWE8_UNCEI|nr:MAG: hypothetical protein E6K72_06010 [Candidatus Eisenbacteria bacterium]
MIVRLWCGVAGDSEWALRLPSAVPGVLLVPAMAWLAALWLGRGAALPAAWLAAGSPYLVWYSQEARCYSLLMLCVVLSCVALLSLARRPGARAALVYGAAAAAGLLSSFSFVMIAPLHLRWWRCPGLPASSACGTGIGSGPAAAHSPRPRRCAAIRRFMPARSRSRCTRSRSGTRSGRRCASCAQQLPRAPSRITPRGSQRLRWSSERSAGSA